MTASDASGAAALERELQATLPWDEVETVHRVSVGWICPACYSMVPHQAYREPGSTVDETAVQRHIDFHVDLYRSIGQRRIF